MVNIKIWILESHAKFQKHELSLFNRTDAHLFRSRGLFNYLKLIKILFSRDYANARIDLSAQIYAFYRSPRKYAKHIPRATRRGKFIQCAA